MSGRDMQLSIVTDIGEGKMGGFWTIVNHLIGRKIKTRAQFLTKKKITFRKSDHMAQAYQDSFKEKVHSINTATTKKRISK